MILHRRGAYGLSSRLNTKKPDHQLRRPGQVSGRNAHGGRGLYADLRLKSQCDKTPKQQRNPSQPDPRHKPIPPVAGVEPDGEQDEDGAEGLSYYHHRIFNLSRVAQHQCLCGFLSSRGEDDTRHPLHLSHKIVVVQCRNPCGTGAT